MKTYGKWRYSSTILDLGTSWRWVVSFTPLPLYPRGKSPLYTLDMRLRGPHSRSGRRGEEKILDPTGTRTPIPRSSSLWPVAIPTALSRLLDGWGSGGITPPFLTSTLDEVSGQLHALAALPPGEQPQSRSGRYGSENIFAPAGNLTHAYRPLARRYTDWAIPGPL
jgi:hypothetical protein